MPIKLPSLCTATLAGSVSRYVSGCDGLHLTEQEESGSEVKEGRGDEGGKEQGKLSETERDTERRVEGD